MKRLNLLIDPRIAKLYRDVPADERERYTAFLRAYPYRLITHAGTEWEYLVTEPTGDDLLLLSGALCAPEVSWQTIAGLSGRHRVIAPEYPPVKSMDALVDGIAAILREEGVSCAHVVGGSYGGFVAQAFVRRHPELTRSLVLSHTLPPYPESAESAGKLMRWLELLPESLLRGLMVKRLSRLLPARSAETAGLHAIYQEMLRYRLTKADLLAILWRTIDYNRREFSPKDLVDWPGKTLLVLTDDDPGTPEPVRNKLQALYPDAKLHLFRGGGHASSITHQAEYLRVINLFLDEQ